MKSRIFFAAVFVSLIMISCSTSGEDAKTAWGKLYPQILKEIVSPTFRDATYNITEYGAVSDTPGFLNHKVINSTIDLCSKEGGGTVVIPKGTWLTGPIVLKSNVNLHIDEEGVLLFSSDYTLYPKVLTRWEGMDCYNTSPMIYAYEQENIAITGKGTIDGGASRENWWGMRRHVAIPGQELKGRALLMAWSESSVPVEERKLEVDGNLRPQLINLYKCKKILIQDLTLTRPAFWVIHPLMCENMTVRGVTIQSQGAPNGDGCNPESCKNILIENCSFNTGDDCIAIKSGRNNDGRKWNIPSENIIVRNCHMENGHGGVVIGSEISGGYRNLFVEDCDMNSPSLERVIRIKTSNCRGGLIENVYVRNVIVGECREAVLKINLVYEPNEICTRDFPPFVRNVYLENVICKKSRYGVFIDTFKDITNISNINLINCEWTGVAEDNNIEGLVEGLKFENTSVNGKIVEL